MEVDVAVRDAVANCHTAGMRLVYIRDGDHFNLRDVLVIIQVDLSDLAHTDYTYAQIIGHASLLVGLRTWYKVHAMNLTGNERR
jgi:hypothetical protein